jgi:hypothetical protein
LAAAAEGERDPVGCDRGYRATYNLNMSQAHTRNYPDEIVHPTCVTCGAPTWLTRIEPDAPDHEKWMLECQACGNSTMDTVKVR